MSVHQEEIARLTGKLVLQLDTKPLQSFMKTLENIGKKLESLSTSMERFNKLSSKSIRFKVDTKELDAARAKLKQLEGKAVTAKVNAAIQQHVTQHYQKSPTAPKEVVAAHEAKLAKAQAAQALADKRVAQAQAQVIKSQGMLATIAQKAQAHSAVLTQKAQSLGFQQQRQTQQATQSAQRHASQQQTAANRHTIQQQQIAKNAHHAANGYTSSKPSKGSGGGMSTFFGGHFGSMFNGASTLGNSTGMASAVEGLVGAFNPVLGALGGFGIAVGAAAGLVHLMNEHLEKRQESVTDSEQFVLALKSFSEDPKEQKALADSYIATNKKYALQTNVETARQYSMQARTLMSVGKSAGQAGHMIDSQDAMIRAANMSAQSQNSFKNELNHLIVGGKGSLTAAQWRSLWNSLGALGPLVQQQTAAVMGYKR